MQPNELKFSWLRVNNDVNGNPRYVVHFIKLLTLEEQKTAGRNGYEIAIKRANKLGGKKFHNKQFGGGLCFSSYSLPDTEKRIFEELSAAMAKEKESQK
jgi:hypothetical protein